MVRLRRGMKTMEEVRLKEARSKSGRQASKVVGGSVRQWNCWSVVVTV